MESFSPFRVVGSVCGELPVSSTMLYGAPQLMVATGRTFQLFRGKELTMLRGGPHFEKRVRAVTQAGKYRFVAEGPRIHAFVHHKPLWNCMHNDVTQSRVDHILAVDDILFCVGNDKRVVVREIKSGNMLTEFLVDGSEETRAMITPAGYNNKLLLATAQGSLQLYNFKSGVCLWREKREPGAQITALAASNFKDIIAYGTSNGRVVVLNMATNEDIMSFDQEERGAVTALAFRTDKDVLVAGSSSGEVAMWDLENGCLDGLLTRGKQVKTETEVLESPHTNTVHSIVVLPTETATIVTAGADNALMQFRFDTVDGLGVLVRERRGHMGSCTEAKFYNSDLLLTAGTDRSLRVTHLFSDRASWELSQGQLGRRGREKQMGREAMKMPPAVAIASCTARNYQWASIVSIHESSSKMCGWRMDTRSLDCKLSGIKTSMHIARAVAMSDCGNFAVIGYSSGDVSVVSIQNKGVRQLLDSSLKPDDRAHCGSVECVEVACGNNIVVTAGLDSMIKLWSLFTCRLRTVVKTDCPLHKSCIHQPSSLFIAAQHFSIRVYHCNPDIGLTTQELRVPVRTFSGHTSPITALALAPDSYRYVVSASGDAALLVWDLASSACVGQYRLASPAISLAFHPDALFMVSTHAGERGAFLWSNNLRYGFVPEVITDPRARSVEELPQLHFPTAHGAAEDAEDDTVDNAVKCEKGLPGSGNEIKEEGESDGNDDGMLGDIAGAGGNAEQEVELFDAKKDTALMQIEREKVKWAELDEIISGGMRLAGVPRSMWFDLTLLEQIREKNQPLLPPKKRDVPFFLPTTQELRPTFLVAASNSKDKEALVSRVVSAPIAQLTPVQQMLVRNEHDAFLSYILSLGSPQAVDLEIKRAVDYVEGCSYTEKELERIKDCLHGLLSFVAEWLKRRENVDLVQGILAAVIHSHGPLITKCGAELINVLEELAELQNSIRYSVDHLIGYPSCLAGTFSGSHF
ncbi:PQQ-like domain/WD domain, G-beta repeat/Utp21 specific WD40 associated putative domain containing protein, putative [Trypanosoma equiperdum]|uniref:PQQ-like domain/WD domain, G-beta repeat/Utp21 specific WD40 associated putative domain containing protein, putative n=1 Tax=Trypanosoma equiperdum TaxID=5694 RepID=A0A1G4IJV1_TRYEQ|nr:PQQ-like domain/WD domain, G-beta repeat/Utp21 specific WD40 associated putative domain containing protein, putative [Trypanosoma equiperdum]